MTREIPSFLRALLVAPPRAGEGVHGWLFRVARQLHAHLPAGQIVRLLESRVADCGRYVPRNEIVSAVQDSLACAWRPSQRAIQKPAAKWPAVNQEQREAIIRDGGGLADLWEKSPVRLEDNKRHTEEIIDRLFPGNPLLCVGRYIPNADGPTEHYTKARDEWRDLEQWELIVPSPMSAPTGLTKEGKESAHTLSNTGPRRFLICEFDTGAPDDHAAILLHLGKFAPLVCATHSGGKSLHGWFFVNGQLDDKVARFFRYAVSLGADRATWTRSQFVRMPDGTRDTGARQTVYFLNFKSLEVKQ